MEHIAIDLGGSKSQICVRSSDGKIVEERRWPTSELPLYLGMRPPSRVILETCAEAFAVADAALGRGHEVRVVEATLARTLGVGKGGKKTDRRDAQALSEVSCKIDLPSVHIPSAQARERKTQCGMRDGVVASRTELINRVRGWARQQLLRIPRGAIGTFSRRVRPMMGDKALPDYVDELLLTIDWLSDTIRRMNRKLEAIAKADPVCRRLMTVPGVGWLTALRFTATLDGHERFADGHRVASYVGLVPGEYQSSGYQRRTGITKAGSTAMRWILVQAAWAALRTRRKDALHHWYAQVEQRRGKKVAVVALARKLSGILFAIWRDGATYQAERAITD